MYSLMTPLLTALASDFTVDRGLPVAHFGVSIDERAAHPADGAAFFNSVLNGDEDLVPVVVNPSFVHFQNYITACMRESFVAGDEGVDVSAGIDLDMGWGCPVLHGTSESFGAVLERAGTTFVAFDVDATPAGHLNLNLTLSLDLIECRAVLDVDLTSLFVRPAYRKQAFGTSLGLAAGELLYNIISTILDQLPEGWTYQLCGQADYVNEATARICEEIWDTAILAEEAYVEEGADLYVSVLPAVIETGN